jgi:DNA modification methylase
MSLAFAEHDVAVWQGDAREQLTHMPAGSVQCAVTSPPYFGLRDYGTGRWEGGAEDCDHARQNMKSRESSTLIGPATTQGGKAAYLSVCGKCGAYRVDEQLGLESSPAEYVARMVAVFAEVRRVLAADGVLWLNLGSSYVNGSTPGPQGRSGQRATRTFTAEGLGYVADDGVRLDAPSHDTACKERSDSPGPDCACSDLCDGCAAVRSCCTAGTGQPVPVTAGHLERTTRDTARPDSAGASPASALPDAPASTIRRSSAPLRGSCSHCDNCGACLAVLRSSGRDAQACARRERYTPGTSRTVSDDRNQGTDASGMAWLNYTGALGPKNLLPIPWMVAMSLQADGWILRNAITWAKPNSMPESVTDRLSTRYELVFLFSKSRRYWFDLDPIRERHTTSLPVVRKGLSRNRLVSTAPGSGATDEWGALGYSADGRNPGDVWSIPTSPFPGAHFACMPPALAERCIKAGCPPGGTVLDPFAGSGTTLAAARKLGRKSVGIELNPDYIDLIRARIGQAPLEFEAAAPVAVEPCVVQDGFDIGDGWPA